MKNLDYYVKFYMCSTYLEFFQEMSNCLEVNIDSSNWKDYLSQFEKSYNSWVQSFN